MEEVAGAVAMLQHIPRAQPNINSVQVFQCSITGSGALLGAQGQDDYRACGDSRILTCC